jgi:hypothetical protein
VESNEKDLYPDDLTDRKIYDTPIGPVCMSRREYEDYQDQLALRKGRQDNKEDHGEEEHIQKD